jgi:ankyrin repeat protein
MHRTTTPKIEANHLSSRSQQLLTAIQSGLAIDLLALKPTFEELLEAHNNNESLFNLTCRGKHQSVRDAIYRVITKAYINPEKAGVMNIEHQSKFGYTLLHWAVTCRQDVSLLDFMATLQFNMNAQSEQGRTALSLACQQESQEIAHCLINNGADVNLADASKSTPLHYAARINHAGLVKLLIDHQANALLPDEVGITALDVAIISGNVDTIRVMMECNTDFNQASKISKAELMKLAQDKAEASLTMKGFLCASLTEIVSILPEQLAMILGKHDISDLFSRCRHQIQADHAVKEIPTPPNVPAEQPVEVSEMGKRLLDNPDEPTLVKRSTSVSPPTVNAVTERSMSTTEILLRLLEEGRVNLTIKDNTKIELTPVAGRCNLMPAMINFYANKNKASIQQVFSLDKADMKLSAETAKVELIAALKRNI